jgi:threonine dehydratase
MMNKSCLVVMPEDSAKVKVDAVREFGGRVEFVDVSLKSRMERVRELASQHAGAYIASAYDDPLVIEGNASLGCELAALDYVFDDVVAPIGGGGLCSGIIDGIRQCGGRASVVGAEPLLGNDAARSFREGRIVRNEREPQTIADGARTISLGESNWAILKGGLDRIVEVPEENIWEGVKVLFELANLKAEPTGALSIGALLTEPARFQGRSVCCVVSGANVDPMVYAGMISSRVKANPLSPHPMRS